MNTIDGNQNNLKRITFDDFDTLNLKPFAENLLQNIEKGIASFIGAEGAYTISLNAEFGNGKTTFLEMFKVFIEEDKEKNQVYNMISINAWESDFYKEPVIAILSEFANYMKKNNEEDKWKKITETIGKIGINIGNQFVQAKTGINLKEIKFSLENGNNLLKTFNQRKEAIKDIKTAFSEYTKDKKLLIIVDELDRARPDHAVHFLEDMKHFFDIKNVVFLVAVNRKQMKTTVKCLYGQNMDFDGYYRKFFKQEIDLPDPYKEAQKLVDDLIKKTKVKYYTKDENNNKYDPIHRDTRVQNSYLSCKMFNLTLREIEYFITIFENILGSKEKIINWISMDAYSFFICLFIKERGAFNKILHGNFSVDNFIKFIDEKNFKYIFDETLNTKIEYQNNLLLGFVACSLIYDQNSLQKDGTKINQTFKTVMNIERLFLSSQGGFMLGYGQPALNICKKINECKSVFKE